MENDTRLWKTILAVGAIILIIGWVVAGFWITGVVGLLVLIILGGGALLYRVQGPPER